MSPTGRQRLADIPLPLFPSLSAKNSATSFAVQPPFATPKAVMVPEIEKVKEGLKRETRFVEVAGLRGIQINGTHGFLLG